MSDKPSSRLSGPPTPAVAADGNSVVSVRQIANTKANSLSMKIEIESDPRSHPSGYVGQLPQADYIAQDASVICADNISGVTIDGNMDFTVSVKKSHVCAGTIEEKVPPSKDSSVKMITEHKVGLIDCLMADHSFILQHVHARHIITDRQYQNLRHISEPEETVTKLIDQVIFKGLESCSLFLEILKEPEILRTYPQLRQITKKMC